LNGRTDTPRHMQVFKRFVVQCTVVVDTPVRVEIVARAAQVGLQQDASYHSDIWHRTEEITTYSGMTTKG